MKKTLCALQPTYIPWMPFFERIYLSDIFVILDDVEFSKNSNHNRNSIMSNSKKLMLTVPIHHKSRQLIKDVKIDNSKNWKKKHWFSIKQSYEKLFFFKEIKKELEIIYSKNWIYLSELNIEIIKFLLRYFKIKKKIFISSEIQVKGTANEKLINLCKYFNTSSFMVKPETENYHPKVLKHPAPDVLFKNFGDSSLDFTLRIWVQDLWSYEVIESDIRYEVDKAFRENSIEIPFPQRVLHNYQPNP